MGESNGCTAMDQIFHIACFICINCGMYIMINTISERQRERGRGMNGGPRLEFFYLYQGSWMMGKQECLEKQNHKY